MGVAVETKSKGNEEHKPLGGVVGGGAGGALAAPKKGFHFPSVEEISGVISSAVKGAITLGGLILPSVKEQNKQKK